MRYLRLAAFVLACWGMRGEAPAFGQGREGSPGGALEARFRAGLDAYAAADYEGAARAFAAVVEQAPLFAAAGEGLAVYWLGRAWEGAGDAARATAAWEAGLTVLAADSSFDPALADAYVRAVFDRQDEARYGPAAEAYLALLAPLGPGASPASHAHLDALALIVPPAVAGATGLAARRGRPEAPLAPDAGQRLVRWWRSQDPFPATPENERLVEHLARTAYAARHYRREDGDGLDARGELYVRFGPPFRETTITMLDPVILVEGGRMPENVFWVFANVERSAQYLLVRRPGRGYEQGVVEDLIPQGLRATARTPRRAMLAVRFLAEVYRQLAHLHVSYAGSYHEVADYQERLEELARYGGGAQGEDRPPVTFVHLFMAEAGAEERQAVLEREALVPQHHTSLGETLARLPVSLRWARFLAPDGTTRTEVYWSVAAEALAARRERAPHYLLQLTAAQQTEAYEERVVHLRRHLLPAVARGLAVPPRTLTLEGDTGTYHVALQWEVFAAELTGTDTAAVRPGERLRVGLHRLDSLRALGGPSGGVEMSDLKPVLVDEPAGVPELPAGGGTPGVPYPFAALPARAPLALYFEVYHLTPGAAGEVRYAVEYEVRHREPGGLLRLLGRRRPEGTAARTRHTGTGPTAQEFIYADLSEWEGSGELVVTVRVTDESSGRSVERTLTFGGG